MKTLPTLVLTLGLAAGVPQISYAASPSEPKHVLLPSAPRTVTVSETDEPPAIRTGLLQATLIVLPQEEKVATVFGGDTVNWVFDGGHVASRFISVKPKTAGSSTDLHIVSDHGNEYTLQPREVSADADPHFDSKVLIAPGGQVARDKLVAMPVFVLAADLEKAKADTAAAKADTTAALALRLRQRKFRPQRLKSTGASIPALSTSITPGTGKRATRSVCNRSGMTTGSPTCGASFRRRRRYTR